MEMRDGGSSTSAGMPEAKRARTEEYVDLTASSPPSEILQTSSQADDVLRS